MAHWTKEAQALDLQHNQQQTEGVKLEYVIDDYYCIVWDGVSFRGLVEDYDAGEIWTRGSHHTIVDTMTALDMAICNRWAVFGSSECCDDYNDYSTEADSVSYNDAGEPIGYM